MFMPKNHEFYAKKYLDKIAENTHKLTPEEKGLFVEIVTKAQKISTDNDNLCNTYFNELHKTNGYGEVLNKLGLYAVNWTSSDKAAKKLKAIQLQIIHQPKNVTSKIVDNAIKNNGVNLKNCAAYQKKCEQVKMGELKQHYITKIQNIQLFQTDLNSGIMNTLEPNKFDFMKGTGTMSHKINQLTSVWFYQPNKLRTIIYYLQRSLR